MEHMLCALLFFFIGFQAGVNMAYNNNGGCLTIIVIILLLWCCSLSHKVDKMEEDKSAPSMQFNYGSNP